MQRHISLPELEYVSGHSHWPQLKFISQAPMSKHDQVNNSDFRVIFEQFHPALPMTPPPLRFEIKFQKAVRGLGSERVQTTSSENIIPVHIPIPCLGGVPYTTKGSPSPTLTLLVLHLHY